MKKRYIILITVFLSAFFALFYGSSVIAENITPVKVAFTPFKILGGNEERDFAKSIKAILFEKALKIEEMEFIDPDKTSSAPPDVKLLLTADISLQGEVAIVALKILDPENGNLISSEMISGSPKKPEEIAARIIEIIGVEIAAISSGDEQPSESTIETPDVPPPTPPAPQPVSTHTVEVPASESPMPNGTETRPEAKKELRIRSRGAAVMPVERGRVSLARKGAMVLAKRDAIERALGVVVDLVAAPEEQRRKVISTLSGKVDNVKIITDERRDKIYMVQLEADIVIPAELTDDLPPPPLPETIGLPPALQPFPKGYVNWADGFLVATGSGKIVKKGAQGEELAKRAARMDAYAVALEMIKGINYDPDRAMADVFNKQRRIEYRIQGLVQGAELVKTEKKENMFEDTIRVPLWGLKGVTLVFKELFKEMPRPKPFEEQPGEEPGGENDEGGDEPDSDARPYTGLLVDARGTGALPALFPTIEDTEGNLVYGAGMVTLKAMTNRGASAYAINDKASEQGSILGPNPIRTRALGKRTPRSLVVAAIGPGAWGSYFASAAHLTGPWLLTGAAAKVSIRQGDNPAPVKAEDSAGNKKATIVISTSAAQLVRESTKTNNYLADARVVIIIDTMVGATEGRKLPFGEGKLARLGPSLF